MSHDRRDGPSSRLHQFARAALASQGTVDHPVITRCGHSSTGLPSFVEGCPHVTAQNLELFARGLRDDLSVMDVVPAERRFRRIPDDEGSPVPESCTPYVDANSLGFYLVPSLPLLFVRSRSGEALLDARVALKYLRENSGAFREVLARIEQYARNIFRSDAYGSIRQLDPLLVSDVVQPYTAFTQRHVSFRAGLWAHTPLGTSTVLGPLVNQQAPIRVLSGAVETDWHHFELFVVAEIPDFTGQVMLIEPGRPLAQLYFVNRVASANVDVRFSPSALSADPAYWSSWERLGAELIAVGKGQVAMRRGVASVDISCPHCWVSVTAAVEGGVPADHVLERGFNPAYKTLKYEAGRARKDGPHGGQVPDCPGS